MKLLVLLCCFVAFTQSALNINSYDSLCDISMRNLPNKDYNVTKDGIGVAFNLRGFVTHDKPVVAYIYYPKNESKIFFDHEFVERKSESNQIILWNNSTGSTFKNHPHCELLVEMDCAYPEVPELRKNGDCKYKIMMKVPSKHSTSTCGVIIHNRLLDLTPLKKKYTVHSVANNVNTTFSISLCSENEDCQDQASTCDVTNETNHILISKRDSELIRYNDITGDIELTGKAKIGKAEKKLQIIFKCNWFKNDSEPHYKVPQIQGKNYKFEMESWHACVKLPPTCEFTDKFYKYNLTGLYNPQKDYEIVTNTSKIYLNVCGPLLLPQSNSCSRTYSQVCWSSNGDWKSKGRLYTEPVVHKDDNHDDVIIMKFISGDECKINESVSIHMTTIYFKCSKTEEKPTFIKDSNCELQLSWKTPKACPVNNIENCSADTPVNNQHFECTYSNKYDTYNLSKLYRQNGYIIRNITENEEYLLNVCGPVLSHDAPCKQNSMVAIRNLREYYNLKKKIHFYGQMRSIYVKNETLVMETAGGDFCEDLKTDFKSTIFFECDKEVEESEIRLRSKTNCSLEFIWKSKYACPNSTYSCTFKDPINSGFIYDFTKTEKSSLTVNVAGTTYLFDICGDNKSCKENSCIYVPVKKSLVTYQNKTHLEFLLNQPCAPVNGFNRTLFELECDNIQNNDHFSVKKIAACTLIVSLKTNRACNSQNHVVPVESVEHDTGSQEKHESVEHDTRTQEKHDKIIPIEQIPDELDKYDTVEESSNPVIQYTKHCTITNPYTDYTFNISRLNLNVSSSVCPDKSFNEESQVVTLIYDTSNICFNKDKRDYSQTIVELKCNNNVRKNSTENGRCFKKFIYVLPEACKLLETGKVLQSKVASSINVGAIIGYVFLGIVALAIPVLLVAFWIHKKRSNNRCYESLFKMGYHKDVDE
ncbi:unnamed protein product [Diabrotica balteata]|uniref:MRH domain-containing protein n=1 Tax=Diabrotica balteata TaxID=107213 RepID=A0A9N9XG05_DIABA|nr:unnamed protein product [Diabrotica balteata]